MAHRLAILVNRVPRCGQDYADIGEPVYEMRFRHRRIAGLIAAANVPRRSDQAARVRPAGHMETTIYQENTKGSTGREV